MDKATEQMRRVRFVGVCVEVTCGDDLPNSIRVNIEYVGEIEVSVEYAWKPIMCTPSKFMGHTSQFCKAAKRKLCMFQILLKMLLR